MKKKLNRALSTLLAVALIAGLFLVPPSAKAAEYYDESNLTGTIDVTGTNYSTGTYPGVTVTGDIIEIAAAGKYKLTGSSTQRIVKVTAGGVSLLLDGVEIETSTVDAAVGSTANGYGICIYGSTTNIYLKPGTESTLMASGNGAGVLIASGGSVNIYGGNTIGANDSTYGKLIARNTGGNGAGIGAGHGVAGGDITITGGYITATGGTGSGAGIGGGFNISNVGSITITGGATIGTATGGNSGAGIGGGYGASHVTGNIEITNSTFNGAIVGGVGSGAGIGGGGGSSGVTGGIEITNSTFNGAIVGGGTGTYNGGAGIGGGDSGSPLTGNIKITGSTFNGAIVGGGSGTYGGGAGIGGGSAGSGVGNIEIINSIFSGAISGSSGGYGGAGIGGGTGSSPLTGIIITGSTKLDAVTGTNGGAAIGNGPNSNSYASGAVKINRNTVVTGTLTPGNADAVAVTPTTGEIWIIGDATITDKSPVGTAAFNAVDKAKYLLDGDDFDTHYTMDWGIFNPATEVTSSASVTFGATVTSLATAIPTIDGATLKDILGLDDDIAAYEETAYTFKLSIAVSGGGSYDTYYTVAFNSNGGSTVASKSVVDGGRVAKPADPTKADYTFAGWFTDAELTKVYDFNAKVTKNFTLYAKWVAVEVEPETPEVWVNPFIDVKAGDWFYGDVEYAVTNGLFNGTSATTFEPGAPMTRAMIFTVLARHAGIDTSGGANWYEQAVAWGVANEITDGTRLNDSVTRREIATLLYRYAGIGADGWGGEALVWVQEQKIMNDGRGDDTATRAEVAAVFRRFAEKVK
jgi:uncharacterized repeat protein (TIGR02543 family)